MNHKCELEERPCDQQSHQDTTSGEFELSDRLSDIIDQAVSMATLHANHTSTALKSRWPTRELLKSEVKASGWPPDWLR